MRRHRDWFAQARADLAAARTLTAAEHFEWACFLAQQGAEKAVKALHESHGTEAWGHSVGELLAPLADVPREVVACAFSLDKHYIPARYPNAHPSGAPSERYTERDAQRALTDAEVVISHVERRLPQA